MPRLLPLLCILLFTSCGQKQHNDTPDPAEAAEQYYSLLARHHYSSFVDGMAYAYDMPQSYRQQLEQLVRQQMETRWLQHGGWTAVKAVDALQYGAEADSANVLLSITYADSTIEQILLPMVCLDDEWFMQ